MARTVPFDAIKSFGVDLPRELALLAGKLETKFKLDDVAEFGPFTITTPNTKDAIVNARPWDIVLVDPSPNGRKVLLPPPDDPKAGNSWIGIKNDSDATSTITIAPITGTIDGATSISLSIARVFQFIFSNGKEWKCGAIFTGSSGSTPPTQVNGYIQRWNWDGALGSTTSATWNVPTLGNLFHIVVIGPGGGGGGGSMKTPCSGGGGGGGGARQERWMSRAEILALQTAGGGSIAVVAGGGGAGGTGAAVVAGSNGTDGTAGLAASKFGTIRAFQGGFGFKGQRTAQTSGGGGGGGWVGPGANGVQNLSTLGGQPQDAAAVPISNPGAGGGGVPANGALAASGGCSIWGGGGGGCGTTNPAVPSNGGRSCYGGGGGGSGGSWDSTAGPGAAAGNGGATGDLDGTSASGGGGTGGNTGATGGNGTDGIAGTDTYCGSGGGGGGSARNAGTSNAGNGGNGGFPGGGGGGGGARVEAAGTIGAGSVAGNGGNGGSGQVIVESYY